MKKQPKASTAAQAQERECHVWLEQGIEHGSFAQVPPDSMGTPERCALLPRQCKVCFTSHSHFI